MKKNLASLLATAAVVLATCGAAQVMAQEQTGRPAAAVTTTTTLTATVTKIDKKDRWVTLKLADGTLVDVQAGAAVKNFDQIKVGDHVTAKQEEIVAIAVLPGGEAAPVVSSASAMTTAPPGTKPMGVVVETVTVSGKVTAIDYAKRTVTVVGPAGNAHTLEVGPEAKRFDAVKKGDDIVLTVKTATTIEVTAPPKGPAPKPQN